MGIADIELPSIEWTPQPWRAFAACKGHNPETFFSSKPSDWSEAKKICASCPVQFECLTWACTADIEYGVFGGRSTRERNHYLKGADDWKVCGTRKGIDAHYARNETLCRACAAALADNIRMAENKQRYKRRRKEEEDRGHNKDEA